MGDFAGVEALSFECYGTLVDWEKGIAASLAEFAGRCELDAATIIDEFARVETVVQQHHPQERYPRILARVLREIGTRHGCGTTVDEERRFGRSVGEWPTFPDSPAALQTLKQRFKLLILSNVDLDSFSRSNTALGVEFDRVLTAEEIGAYKPDPRTFASLIGAVRALGIRPGRLVHVAQSRYHDLVPAANAGLRTVWINRRSGRAGPGATPLPNVDVIPDWEFRSMEDFAVAARADELR